MPPVGHPDLKPSPLAALTRLLVRVFSTAANISAFVRSYTGIDVVAKTLPADTVSVEDMGHSLACRLQDHGLVTENFFLELLKLRPFHASEIQQTAQAWGFQLAIGSQPPSPWTRRRSALEEVRAEINRDQNPHRPDSILSQIGKLMEGADDPILSVLLEMADATDILGHRFVALMAGELSDGPVSYMIAPRQDPIFLSAEITPMRFRQMIDLLIHHQMVNRWIGMGSSHNKAPGLLDTSLQHLGKIEDYHLPVWAVLSKYLEPARRARSARG